MSFFVNKYIKLISYKALSLWDVKRYTQNYVQFKNPVKLRDILFPSYKPITKEKMIINNWQIISKINFKGNLFLRDANETISFKGNLHKVDGDSLIYSKINIRHGCIYYHPHNAIPFGVSSEYPAYKIDTTKVLGAYLVLVIQSKAFKAILDKRTTGISKARVKPKEFLDLEIPLPSLSIQKNLLQTYYDKICQADAIDKGICKIEEDINKYMMQALGIVHQSEDKEQDRINDYLQFVKFASIKEWGYDIIQKKQKGDSFIYPIVKIKNLCQVGSGGTPTRSNPHFFKGDIPWIKTGEVINEEIAETEEYITKDAVANSSAKLYPKGSLIIAMYGQGNTRGRTAKLGIDATTNQACAVLYNINNDIVITDYLWYYLQTQYHNLRSMASGNNQPNLNAEKIKNYFVVIPPLHIQKEIVEHIKQQKEQIKNCKAQSELLNTHALAIFEKNIFE